MKTFSKGEIAKSEIAKTGGKTAELRSGAVVIENFKNLLQVKKPVFEN